jgi:hypothetical protein
MLEFFCSLLRWFDDAPLHWSGRGLLRRAGLDRGRIRIV